ncbi:MAG: lysophospholipid acyltransferase family protein [Planctomycetota bacterium]|nr:lysophospholipid acyltransferase family protein [Planctomycetota bacterium]
MKALPSYSNPRLRHWTMPEGLQNNPPFYRLARHFLRLAMPALWKLRVFGRHNEPASGGVAYVANHQSFLDPVVVSVGLQRPVNYMARDNLFHPPALKRLFDHLNAFPVRRGTADLTAVKEGMRRIKAGGQVLVFAEGTRTPDGRIARMLPGVAMLAQRAAQWTVPVLIDGAYEGWPRTQLLPSPGNVVVRFGEPISSAQAQAFNPQDFVDHIRSILIDMQTDTRRRVGRPPLHYEPEFLAAPHPRRAREP